MDKSWMGDLKAVPYCYGTKEQEVTQLGWHSLMPDCDAYLTGLL